MGNFKKFLSEGKIKLPKNIIDEVSNYIEGVLLNNNKFSSKMFYIRNEEFPYNKNINKDIKIKLDIVKSDEETKKLANLSKQIYYTITLNIKNDKNDLEEVINSFKHELTHIIEFEIKNVKKIPKYYDDSNTDEEEFKKQYVLSKVENKTLLNDLIYKISKNNIKKLDFNKWSKEGSEVLKYLYKYNYDKWKNMVKQIYDIGIKEGYIK